MKISESQHAQIEAIKIRTMKRFIFVFPFCVTGIIISKYLGGDISYLSVFISVLPMPIVAIKGRLEEAKILFPNDFQKREN